jgi:hypothetical protein
LLLFWSRNPGGWSSRAAVSPYTMLPRREILKALDQLVAEGVLRRGTERDVEYYALTLDPALRDAVLGLAALSNYERHQLLDVWVNGTPERTDKVAVGRAMGQRQKRCQA